MDLYDIAIAKAIGGGSGGGGGGTVIVEPQLASVVITNSSPYTANVTAYGAVNTGEAWATTYGTRVAVPSDETKTFNVPCTINMGAYGWIEIGFASASLFSGRTLTVTDGDIQAIQNGNQGWVVRVSAQNEDTAPTLTIA